MEKLLKTGLISMLAAVVILPIVVLLKNVNAVFHIGALILAMGLELIGLIFVILSIIRKRKI